jgi:hypothetical protein
MIRSVFRLTYAVLLVGGLLAWLSKDYPAPALVALVCVYASVGVLAGAVGRFIGLPAFRPDEAYSDTLRRWQRERRTR